MDEGLPGGLQSPRRTVDGEVGGRNLTPGLNKRGFLRLAAGTLALAACTAPARAADPERDAFEATPKAAAPVPAGVSEARDDLRDDLGRQALLTVDKETGAVRFLARLDGYLTTAPSNSPAATVRDYLSRRAEAFGVSPSDMSGLELSDRETAGGIQSLKFTQTVDGVPVVDAAVQAHLDESGRLIAITGGPVPDPGLDTDPAVSRDEAQAAAARGLAPAEDTDRPVLVAYTSGNDLRLAWRVLVGASSTAQYDTLVDARSGEVVRRNNLVKFASAPLFDNYPGAPAGGTATSHDLSGPGYYAGGAGLIGPNVHAFADPDDEVPGSDLSNPVVNPPGGETTPSSGDFPYGFDPWTPSLGTQYGENCQDPEFVCSWDPKASSDWSFDSDQAATQLFWYVNVFHDHLEAPPIGFDPASGNFEGSDPIVAQAQDGANTGGGFPNTGHSNNANMLVLPDGRNAFMQMYLWDPVNDADPDRAFRPVHGGDDPSLVFHEYTHGLTNRLVTDPLGYGALNGAQAGAIDEGTADWYALDYLVDQGLFPDDNDTPDVTMAPYEVVGPTGLRSQAIDCPVGAVSAQCPNAGGGAGAGGYTYGDFAKVLGGAEEHADGEIWAQTLWQLRQRLITVHGQGDGLNRVRRLVTDGLRLVPPNPSFLDMRNAILLADVQAGLGDRALIWDVFRQRGMGYAASTRGTDDVAPVPDFTGPPVPSTPVGSMSGTVRDRDTGAPLAGRAGGVLGSRQRPGRGPLHREPPQTAPTESTVSRRDSGTT